MEIAEIVWLDEVVDKIQWKHGVMPDEVEEVLDGNLCVHRVARGRYRGEDVYRVLGQTQSGRYLVVFFILKRNSAALILSAREMDEKERRAYGRQ